MHRIDANVLLSQRVGVISHQPNDAVLDGDIASSATTHRGKPNDSFQTRRRAGNHDGAALVLGKQRWQAGFDGVIDTAEHDVDSVVPRRHIVRDVAEQWLTNLQLVHESAFIPQVKRNNHITARLTRLMADTSFMALLLPCRPTLAEKAARRKTRRARKWPSRREATAGGTREEEVPDFLFLPTKWGGTTH